MLKKISAPPKFLIDKYRDWKSSDYSQKIDIFNNLAKLGQKPKAMVIACCDSRLHPTSIFRAQEGDLFIYRNIANLVPPYSPNADDYGTLASIEYAIIELNIRHIIILGHTGCGGIKSAYNLFNDSKNSNYLFINKWLDIIFPAYKSIQKENSHQEQIDQLEQESIKNSLKNLFTFPNVLNKVKNNKLQVHGLIHDIGSGVLKYLNPETEKFENI
tara:strand:+ start:1539 stop:2183 length:645 start_codon:yes stop_codon:yes gene_type:complete